MFFMLMHLFICARVFDLHSTIPSASKIQMLQLSWEINAIHAILK